MLGNLAKGTKTERKSGLNFFRLVLTLFMILQIGLAGFVALTWRDMRSAKELLQQQRQAVTVPSTQQQRKEDLEELIRERDRLKEELKKAEQVLPVNVSSVDLYELTFRAAARAGAEVSSLSIVEAPQEGRVETKVQAALKVANTQMLLAFADAAQKVSEEIPSRVTLSGLQIFNEPSQVMVTISYFSKEGVIKP